MRTLKFILIEKNPILAEQLMAVISEVQEFSLIGCFEQLKMAENAAVHLPDIILLDIDYESVDEIVLLRQCQEIFPKTDVICMGKQWEEKLAALLFKNGCKGYLVKPFNGKELMRMVFSLKSNLSKLCSVSAFFSPKGKSGRTSLIANLAVALSTKWEQEVAVIDADVQFSDMAVFFNLEPHTTIVEAARDVPFLTPVTLDEYFMPVNDHLKILCGTKSPEAAEYVKPAELAEIIALARQRYQFVLIDMPPAFTPISVAAMEDADNVFVVSMINGTFEMENAQRSMEIFKVWEDFDVKVNSIFTRVWPYTEKERTNLENQLGYPVCLVVPNAYTLLSESVNSGVMAIEKEQDSEFAQGIAIFANRLCHRLGVR